MTAAGRLTSVNRSLGSCTREGAKSDDGAAAVQSKNTRKSLRCNSSALQTVSGRSSSDEPGNRVNFGRTRKAASQEKFVGRPVAMAELRQCVTGKAKRERERVSSKTLRRCRCR